MNFLEHIFEHLRRSKDRPVLQEIRGDKIFSVTGNELLAQVGGARDFLRQRGLQRGDRCALLANNSVRWVVLDLALMAEGIVVVLLYARQAPGELAAILKDCTPRLLVCGDAALSGAIAAASAIPPPQVLFDEIFVDAAPVVQASRSLVDCEPGDVIAILYTSGTSGESKGVCLTVANLNHMLECTTARLDQLMGATREPDRVFHYLPFNFAGSWILLLSCLSRSSILSLSTDLNKLAGEIRLAAPNYFLNVPTLLERIRKGIEENMRKRGGFALKAFENTWNDFRRSGPSRSPVTSSLWRAIAAVLIFPTIRARLGANLRALICGSAPLARDTQLFFKMLGIRVLQVYGLTETTGICTMDDPVGNVEPGFVGPAVPQVEMICGGNQEILVRGPNIFPGYWNRAEETTAILRDGWFHTGDQGEVNEAGNWRIVGRIKSLLILNSGHNIAPEPIEEKILSLLPEAQQIILMGNGRGYLTALVAPQPNAQVNASAAKSALEVVNRDLPHYKQVRAFQLLREPLTIESGLLTANGKLKRDAIAARFAAEIERLYQRNTSETF